MDPSKISIEVTPADSDNFAKPYFMFEKKEI